MTAHIREVGRHEAYQLLPICNVPPGFLCEMRDYEIVIAREDGKLPDDFIFALNDIPLDRVIRSDEIIFPFEMDFYAGDLRVSLARANRVMFSTELQVDPDIAKVTRDEYAVMVAEISQATLALYRLSSVTIPALVSAEGQRSDIVALELVRTNFDVFERAVSHIADQPVRALRSSTASIDILRARRIDDRAIGSALRRGLSREATPAETLAAPRLVRALGGRWIPQVVDTRREEAVDIYEHRALFGFLRWLDATLSDIARRLQRAELSDVALSARAFYLERISRWRARITRLARRGLFAELSPDPAMHATSIFRTHPDYASAFSTISRMRSGLGMGVAATPSISIDRTFELYELWCYIGLLAAVAERFPASHQKVAEILRGCQTPNGLGTALLSGRAGEIPLTGDLRIGYRRRFTPKSSADGARTLLLEVIPDITIALLHGGGACSGLVLLDPKYRAGQSLLDGLRDMHVYRDAIIGHDGDRLVRAAAAVAPRPAGLPLATTALPFDRPGILAVRPGQHQQQFQNLLDISLRQLGPPDSPRY